MSPVRNISYLSPLCCKFWEKCINSHKIGHRCSTPLKCDFSVHFRFQCDFQCSSSIYIITIIPPNHIMQFINSNLCPKFFSEQSAIDSMKALIIYSHLMITFLLIVFKTTNNFQTFSNWVPIAQAFIFKMCIFQAWEIKKHAKQTSKFCPLQHFTSALYMQCWKCSYNFTNSGDITLGYITSGGLLNNPMIVIFRFALFVYT